MSGAKKCKNCGVYTPAGDLCICIQMLPDGKLVIPERSPSPAFIEYKPLPKYLTLPTDSNERKEYPLFRGCLKYFPAALAGVAKISKVGNDKHNPGEELHHARGKSTDHPDCIMRHLMDVADILAQDERSALTPVGIDQLLGEVSSLAWRALAYSQELHEKFGAPLAPGASKPKV